jgi:hypothetical protein
MWYANQSWPQSLVNGQVKMGLNGHEKSPQMAIELKK